MAVIVRRDRDRATRGLRDRLLASVATIRAVRQLRPPPPTPAPRSRLAHTPWPPPRRWSSVSARVGVGLSLRPAAARRRPSRSSPRPTCAPCRATSRPAAPRRWCSPGTKRGRAGDEQRRPARSGHGVSDVADRRGRRAFGGHDGRQGRRAVDHRRAARSRRLPRRWRSPSSPAAVRRSRPARCSPNCRWSEAVTRSVAAAASARTSATSCAALPRPPLPHRSVAVLGDAGQFVVHHRRSRRLR